MRAAAGLALLLAGCSPVASGAAAGSNGLIDCATGGAAAFTHDCAVERHVEDGAVVLIVRHPDGAFRRFKVLDGGQSLAAADGAEALAIAADADRLDIGVDGDRYRIPKAMLTDADH